MQAPCRPDSRAWRTFPALSGGQQALATLALSFALQAAYPSPLYFFDEIDCALDSSAAARVAEYIRSQAGSQYIVVSHKPQVPDPVCRCASAVCERDTGAEVEVAVWPRHKTGMGSDLHGTD